MDITFMEFFERTVEAWHQKTGAHPDTIRLLFLKAAINADVTPNTVATIAANLEDIFTENYKPAGIVALKHLVE